MSKRASMRLNLEKLGFIKKDEKTWSNIDYNSLPYGESDFFYEVYYRKDDDVIVSEKKEWRYNFNHGGSTRNIFIGKLENDEQLLDILINGSLNNTEFLREIKIKSILNEEG